ncbi:MAG: amino acid adenylation domain-containing protein [Acidimicrobiia bacterium]|nr:amino acid adenylation domain-containing protein [Acidimicrobiia bacterium]
MTTPGSNLEAIYPLSPVQEGILFHTLYSPEAPLYVQQYVSTIEGDLDVPEFRENWNTVIRRHQVLRSLLTWEGREQPLQVVLREVDVEWAIQDWSESPHDEQERKLDDFLATDRERGFRLDAAPLFRFALIRTGADTHRFVWTHHHVILDGWSLGLVLNEVWSMQSATSDSGQADDAPSYRDYVRWLKGYSAESSEEYWRNELAGVTAATPVGLPGAAGERWAELHGETTARLDDETTQRLLEYGRTRGLTLNTLLRAAWAYVLSRYSGSNDVVFGTTFSGRPAELPGALEMVGLFINTLPVRVQVPVEQPIEDWLKVLQGRQIEALDHELTPLANVQRWSEVPSGEPLFDSLLVVENVPHPELGSGELAVTDVRYLQRSNYPLAILAMPGEQLELIFLYDRDRFGAGMVQRLANQVLSVLTSLVTAETVADLVLFPADEMSEVIVEWNRTEREYPHDETMHGLIAQAATATPQRLAVVGGDVSLDYAALAANAATVAGALHEAGVQRGDRVGVLVGRSPAAIVAILGVLEAGAAYVPLDPDLPAARTSFILADTAAKAVITTHGTDTDFGLATIELDETGLLVGGSSGRARQPVVSAATDLAYVLYTSGSTGQPKGVAVSHRSLVNSTLARRAEYGDLPETFLLLSPLIFDSSIAGLFSTLVGGGTLVLPGSRMEQDVGHVAGLIGAHGVTHTLALPSVYQLLLELADADMLRSLQLVMVAGEPCPPALVDRHYGTLPDTALSNEYGPTESTVWCSVHHLDAAQPTEVAGERVPIGRPIANTQLYILDAMGRPAPVGVPGELCVAGDGLAAGYHERPEQTVEAFVVWELPAVGPTRLYRTGDVARYLDDGTIDLVGRVDHQVKIRGQRIELGEIEAVLRSHPDVRDAVVTVHATGAVPALAGFVEPELPTGELLDHAAARLPRAMVPATLDALAVLPRGSTGKVDRAALPDPRPAPVPTEHVAPRDPVEKALAEIWSEVLGIESVGVHEDFFALGGDSLLSIRVIARGHKAGIRITPKQFFDAPTVAGLAAAAGAGGGSEV